MMRNAEGTGVFKKFWGCDAVLGFGQRGWAGLIAEGNRARFPGRPSRCATINKIGYDTSSGGTWRYWRWQAFSPSFCSRV